MNAPTDDRGHIERPLDPQTVAAFPDLSYGRALDARAWQILEEDGVEDPSDADYSGALQRAQAEFEQAGIQYKAGRR